MAILDLIDRLINERGSATILRERILLIREQCSDLETKLKVLERDNGVLKEENVRLQKENTDLLEKVKDSAKPRIGAVRLMRS